MSVLDNLAIAQARGRLGSPFARRAHGGDRARPRAARVRRLPRRPRARAPPTCRTSTGAWSRSRARSRPRPSVLLLDEPAAGLSRDDKQRARDAPAPHRRSRHRGGARRARHVARDGHLRPRRGARRRRAHRRRHAARRAAGPGGAEGLSRRGRRAARRRIARAERRSAATLLEVGTARRPATAPSRCCTGIDLRVRDREMVAVLGANGAGKSTLMRALAGPASPGRGRDQPRRRGARARSRRTRSSRAASRSCRKAGRCSPSSRCSTTSASAHTCARDASDAEIEAMLERFPRLRARLHQRAGLLSGGEQQMLALARGLMAKPAPAAARRALARPRAGGHQRSLRRARPAARAKRATILLVDQMAGLALTLADRAYVIEGGQIVASGTAAEIARRRRARAGVPRRRGAWREPALVKILPLAGLETSPASRLVLALAWVEC